MRSQEGGERSICLRWRSQVNHVGLRPPPAQTLNGVGVQPRLCSLSCSPRPDRMRGVKRRVQPGELDQALDGSIIQAIREVKSRGEPE